jgi:hypothetical protein
MSCTVFSSLNLGGLHAIPSGTGPANFPRDTVLVPASMRFDERKPDGRELTLSDIFLVSNIGTRGIKSPFQFIQRRTFGWNGGLDDHATKRSVGMDRTYSISKAKG